LVKEDKAWVHKVHEEEIKFALRISDEQGNAADTVDLSRTHVYRHPVRDLVAFKFKDAVDGENFIDKHNLQVFDSFRTPQNNERLLLSGHRCVSQNVDNKDVSLEIPQTVEGEVLGVAKVSQLGQLGEKINLEQGLAHAATTLEMGMCGAPVFQPETRECKGMVEAIMAHGPEAGRLAVFIPGKHIEEFLESIDSGENASQL